MSAAARARRERRLQTTGAEADDRPILALPGPLMPTLDLYGTGIGAPLLVGEPEVRLLLSPTDGQSLHGERHTVQTASCVETPSLTRGLSLLAKSSHPAGVCGTAEWRWRASFIVIQFDWQAQSEYWSLGRALV